MKYYINLSNVHNNDFNADNRYVQ